MYKIKSHFSTSGNILENLVDELNSLKTFNDIESMIKEGSIFNKYGLMISSSRKKFVQILSEALGLSNYYVLIRVRLLNINPALINAYIEGFIQFFDIQNIITFSKEGQLKVLDKLLWKTMRTRDERVQFYKEMNREFVDDYRKKISTLGKRRKKSSSVKDDGNSLVAQLSEEKEERRNIKELQAKRIAEQNQKINEMRALIPTPIIKTADQLKEKEYYENMDMVVVSSPIKENNHDDWKKRNGY